MPSLNEIQLRNLKRKVVDFIWKTTPEKVIEIARILGIKVQKNLQTKVEKED
jgi:hypothetical protein